MSSEAANKQAEPPSECSPAPAPATPSKQPAPKKYANFNINKKFLDKQHPPSQPATPKNGPAASSSKPAPAPSTPHSRLVAAKLTAAPQTANAQGWSRPASAAPSAPISPAPSTSSANPHPPGPPQLPHVGKVIQPQPRPSPASALNGKPAWGNVKPSPSPDARPAAALSDFPTAAEAQKASASPKAIKTAPSPATSDAPSNKFEADTFRGVHLKPNAHHWDEMVEGEDSDDFLGGVIEFEDGRQYQVVESNEPAAAAAAAAAPEAPVSKAERFRDDFDRSWPRRPAHQQERALFNERSNKLEPWSRDRERDRNGEPVIDLRNLSRELQPHAPSVQVLPRSPVDHHNHRQSLSPGDERPGSQWGRRRTSFASDHEPPPHRQLPPHVDRQPPPHLGGDRRDMPPPPVPPPNRPPHQPLSTRESWTERTPAPPSRRRESFASHHTLSPDVRSVHTPLSPATSTAPVPAPAPDDLDDVRKAAMHSAAERARIRRQQEEEERAAQKERARLKALALEEKMKEAEKAKEDKEREEREKEEREKEEAKEKEKPIPPPVTAPGSFSRAVRPRMPSFTRDAPPPPMTRTPSQRSVARTPAEEASHWRVHAGPLAPRPPRPAQQPTSPTITRASPVIAQRPSATTSPVIERPPQPPAPSTSDLFSVAIDESVEEVDFADMHTLVGAEGTKPAETTEPAKSEEPAQPQSTPTVMRRQRPVASDYFDAEPQPSPASKSDLESTWRRKAPEPTPAPAPVPALVPPAETEHLKPPSSPRAPLSPSRSAFREASMSSFEVTMARIKSGMDEAHAAEEKVHPHAHVPAPGPTQEATQANKWVPPALRSKQSAANVPTISHPQVPPRPVPASTSSGQTHRLSPHAQPEPFVTQGPRPPSPKPAWNVHPVHLPHTSRAREPLSRKQVNLYQQKSSKVRFDILSFDPPVEGMNAKDLSVVPILFRTPIVGSSIKGKMKYNVKVPTKKLESVAPPIEEVKPATTTAAQTSKPAIPTGPKVNLGAARATPAPAPPPAPAPGPIQRPAPDRASTNNWRERAPATSTSFSTPPAGLETVSRSPPPEMASTAPAPTSAQITAPEQAPVPDAAKTSQAKPRLAEGESLGFYRRDSVGGASGSARFVVNSELDAGEAKVNGVVVNGRNITAGAESKGSALVVDTVEHKAESKSSDGSSDQAPLTPPSSTWPKNFSVKESPARAPDPEHLKLLWQQPSEKLELPAINSLKGIADVDMPVVNFTLQEVKSEDGETPPPTMASAPTAPHPRMSLHDVTRAFQQVPTSSPAPPKPAPSTSASASASTSTSAHTTVSPGGASSTPLRGFAPPGPPGAMRPAYAAYPSPMMGPAPTPVMYPMMAPSPAPGPHPHAPHQMVNGPQPMPYGQPMWVPVPGPQTPNMRPGPIPYPQPGSYVYAPGPAPPGMYPAPGPPPQQQQQQQHPQQPNGTQGKRVVSGPQAQMMSPALGHAHPPMYSGSPAMMHAHAPGGFGPPRTPAPAPMGPYSAPMMHHPGGPPPGPYGTQAAYGPRPPTW